MKVIARDADLFIDARFSEGCFGTNAARQALNYVRSCANRSPFRELEIEALPDKKIRISHNSYITRYTIVFDEHYHDMQATDVF